MSAKLTRPGAMSEGRSFVVCLRRQAIKGGTAGCRHRAILSRVCAARCRDGNGRSDERARSAQTPTRSRRSEWGGRKAWQRAAAFCVTTRLQGLCRAGVFARRLGFAASLGLRDDASIVPYGRGAGHCRVLKDTCGAGLQCTPPPALRAPPLAGEALQTVFTQKAPLQGELSAPADRGVRRLVLPIPFRAAAWGLRQRRASGTMQASSPTDAGQGTAGFCRIPAGQGGNAPFRLRLAAHPPPLAGEAFGGRLSGGSVVAGGWRDDASIAPYGRGAGPCRGLKDTCGAGRQCTPPPALRAPPLAGEAFGGRLSRWVGDYGRFPGRCKHRPYGRWAGHCRSLQDTRGARRQCTPQSAGAPAD